MQFQVLPSWRTLWCYFRLYKVFHDIDTHIRDALFGGETQRERKIAMKTSPLKKGPFLHK